MTSQTLYNLMEKRKGLVIGYFEMVQYTTVTGKIIEIY